MPKGTRALLVAAVLLVAALWLFVRWQPAPTASPGIAEPQPGNATPALAAAPQHEARALLPASDAGTTQRSEAPATAAAPAFIRVRAVDADEQPIAGARVQTFADSTAGATKTDADGWCTLAVGADGSAPMRMLVADEHRHRQAYWQRLPQLTVKLPWTGPLRGRLVDDRAGTPVAGAALRRPHPYCKECEPATTTTATDGTFEFADVPRNVPCTLAVEAAGYPEQYFRLEFPGRGAPIDHTFRLLPGVWIAGRCVDLEDRRGLAAELRKDGAPLGRAGADGSFRFLVLPAADGLVSMRFEAPDHLWVTCRIDAARHGGEQEYPLPRSTALVGTVRDERGAPIANAHVRAQRHSPIPSDLSELPGMPGAEVSEVGYIQTARTDQGGRYRLTGLIADVGYRLTAFHAQYEPLPGADPFGTLAEATREEASADLTLQSRAPTGSIAGTYTYQGAPAEGEIHWRGASRTGYVEIARNGTFRSDAIECGSVVLSVMPEAYSRAQTSLRDAVWLQRTVQIEAGKELRLQLDQQIEEVSITGHVRFPDGAAAAGAQVSILDRELRVHTQTGPDGSYELRVPKAVDRTLPVYSEPSRRDAMPGSTGIDLVVPRSGSLRYRAVSAEDGKDVEAFWSSSRADDRSSFSMFPHGTPGPDGYRVMELAHGAHLLTARVEGFGPVLQRVEISAAPAEVTLRLTRATTVTVRLGNGASAPPASVRVRLIDEVLDAAAVDPRRLMFPRADVDLAQGGTFPDVAPGHHRLVSSDDDYLIVPPFLDVVAGGPTTFELRWQKR